jgi:uncharacterized membrane protein YphA (DoxX/SURF4 family)
MNATNLHRMKLICRWALGLVWIWEGFALKILFRHDVPEQSDLIEDSGLFWPNADTFTVLLGAAMTICGVVLCAGWKERAAVLTATITMTALIFLVTLHHPVSLLDLHGGIPKDLCLYACAWVVWRLHRCERVWAGPPGCADSQERQVCFPSIRQ